MNRAVEVRTPSDGFAATFPKGDGFYPDKLKFVAQFTARAVSFQLGTMYRHWSRLVTVVRSNLKNSEKCDIILKIIS